MASRTQHCWKEITEDGETREVRVTRFGGQWKFQSKLRGAEKWIYHDAPSRADLVMLLDILRRKYQRRRVCHEDVRSIEQMLKQYQR